MKIDPILCEHEAIHLIGRTQYFGKLIILNNQLSIIALSDHVTDWGIKDAQQLLEKPLVDLLDACNLSDANTLLHPIDQVVKKQTEQKTISMQIGIHNYFVHIYLVEDLCYLEFEEKGNTSFDATIVSDYATSLPYAGDNLWTTLCDHIRKIILYDRVMVYQFLEDESGRVIAESKISEAESYQGYRYPEFDIPKQARVLYLKNKNRQTADIDAETFPLLSRQQREFDLSKSAVRALSPIHLQYLKNAGVSASMSFSIIIEGKLWGLIACQNQLPCYVDYNQRTLVQFLTDFTVNTFLVNLQQQHNAYDRQINVLSLKLKEQVLLKNHVLKGLQVLLPEIAELIGADALAIIHPEQNLIFGAELSEQQLLNLNQYINTITPLHFDDHKFLIHHTDFALSNFPFAGVYKLDIDHQRLFSLIAFRKEQIIEEEWAGNPEKQVVYDEKNKNYVLSPRKSFAVWKKENRGTAPKWSKSDRQCLHMLRSIIQESMLQKSEAIEQLNAELIQLNNALDTYSYTLAHDLKNPLSSIKLTGQFLQQIIGKDQPKIIKPTQNILEAVSNIENMLAKILEFSRAKVFKFYPEWIGLERIIPSICADCASQYKDASISYEFDQLLPVYGEKTLLKQLFNNIIGNAFKFSSQEEAPYITIKSYLEKDKICYQIQDNGIGIPAPESARIFEVFKKTSNANRFEGAGIGLAIVKRILERIDAEIKIESQIGKGTIVKLYFNKSEIPALLLSNNSFVDS
ncbi:ATP-binding protein [Sphingobacterium sp. SRCM116780]|uniref:ATP-binding protein n=1 Tax=Sphingobacterium sp. SRCM116780 TaxID=2907623 RepID=UPI001F346EDF|nr:ATP-binding protein [Sphingobacterium sp. SRCM116780]UIR54629.1 ATP-binding protein [Sphingobacterium sp. SRCM116780]